MTTTDIRSATLDDAEAILRLYKAASSSGLARKPDEITPAYVNSFLRPSLASGIVLLIVREGGVCGEIHGWPMGPEQFAHVISGLTIAIHPDAQGQGLGRKLFSAFIDQVRDRLPHIRRIELGCRESNTRGLKLYESLGFVVEGRLVDRVYDPAGFYEDDLMLGLRLPRA